MVRVFAVEDGARKEYAENNKMEFEEGESVGMRIALPKDNAVRDKFLKNFKENEGKELEIVQVFLSTKKESVANTLEHDGWVNKDWGVASIHAHYCKRCL